MNIAIVGGGPAGLRAAEIAAQGGASVTLFDAKASVGRKFLVAGGGGLNLTRVEPRERFVSRFSSPGQPADFWGSLIEKFDSEALRAWTAGMGVETFSGSSGRVYPKGLKAAPLLREWVRRLRFLGVRFEMHHRWMGLRPGKPIRLDFEVRGQDRESAADAVILALGGGSWPETGSDGGWVSILESLDLAVSPLKPANCGWEFSWLPAVLAAAEGSPLKNLIVRAGEAEVQGELLVTKYGLEGGAIYRLGPVLRGMAAPEISIDFKPTFTVRQLVAKMGPVHRNFLREARQRWRLSDAVCAILENLPDAKPYSSAESLATRVKDCRLSLTGPRPLVEAISSAGGVRWGELDETLMVRRFPGVFVAGEMIDWEAPTGGYLIHGCLATGGRAAFGALEWVREKLKSEI